MTDTAARDAVHALWDRQLEAMDAGDADGIRACFAPDAELVHLTGHRQPLDEWLDGVRGRTYVYHRVQERALAILVDAPCDDGPSTTAHVAAAITTGITDDGSGQAWPLRLEQDYARTTDGWRCASSRVTLDR